MDQLDEVTMTDRPRGTADHQLLPDKRTDRQKDRQTDRCTDSRTYSQTGRQTRSPRMLWASQLTHLLGSLTIHQLLTSLKG